MKLLKNIRNCYGVFCLTALLCSCSSAVFPEIVEDDQAAGSAFTTKKGGKIEMNVPSEGKSLQADDENISYEDDEDKELDEAMDSDSDRIILPVKANIAHDADTFSEDSDNLREEESIVEATPLTADDGAPSVSYLVDTFLFANGSAILDSKYNSQIRKIVKEAKANNATVKVLGFASSRTRNTDIASHKLANFKVSSERAESVVKALRRNGLPADKIETEALSDTNPAYQEVMPEGERLNRRVEVYITY